MTGLPNAETAVVPSVAGPHRFGSTANLSPRKKSRLTLWLVLAGAGAVAAVAIFAARPQLVSRSTGVDTASLVAPAAPSAPAVIAPAPSAEATTTVIATPPPATAAAIAAPSPSPAAEPAAEPAPAAPNAVAPAPAPKPTRRKPARINAPAAAATPAAAAAEKIVSPAPVAEPNGPGEEKTPAVRGPREVLAEGEKLLSQGEVGDACARGEEAKRMNPKLVLSYRFLGKCYMRAGNASQANENYRKYLELAPNASDAMFIKSIVK
jgi:hypothetical protein